MNRYLRLACVVLVTAAAIPLFAQDYSQSQSPSDSVYRQNPSETCPDGSSPVPTLSGSLGCPSTEGQQFPSTRGNTESQPNLTSSPQENAPINDSLRSQRTSQSRTLPPEPLTEFQKFVAATTGQLLPVYGANLFRDVPSTFAPDNLAPVSADYTIGPDDELRIRIWGQVTYSGNLRVNRSGDIYLPEVGVVQVAGLQFSALDQHLRSAVARVYRNFDLSVDMGRIRSMQIYVTGQARRPGAYTISSLSTLVDALFASGGPSAQGSMRHIELRRAGYTLTDFDLYALLIHGDKSNDAHLLPDDVLYIPAAGPQVAILGSIHTAGIYELRTNEVIGDLINAAGNTTSIASNGRISLERVGDHQVRQAMEFPFDATGLAAPLASGDIVRIYSVVPAYQKTVMLRGSVANPGRFAWHPGMHISDLIPDKDSLLSRDYWWKRSHLGLPGPEFEPLISNFETNQRHPYRSLPYPQNPYGYSSNGSVPNSAYPYQNQSSFPNYPYPSTNDLSNTANQDPTSPSAQDALAAGFAASEREEEVSQSGLNNQSPIDRQVSGDATLGSQINSNSTSRPTTQSQRVDVRISAPGIDWNYAVIERQDPNTLKTSLVSFDLGKLILQHDTSQDLPIQAGDTITIFSQADIRVPLNDQIKYIHLEGEFVHAGIYSVQPGETLRDLIKRAGGLTNNAYLYGSEFDRESTRVFQQQRIDEYVRRVDLDAGRGTLALTASPTSSSGNAVSASAATAAETQLISRLKQLRATGRIVLNFRSNSSELEEIPAMNLENGDRFVVPPVPATVNIVGAVYDQNSFLYQTGGSAGRYLQMAGGPDRNADRGQTFVIRADGSVVSHKSVKGLWGNKFAELRLNPGDTIVVPDRTLRPTALRGLLDWTQIFSQLAIGAAAVEVLKQ